MSGDVSSAMPASLGLPRARVGHAVLTPRVGLVQCLALVVAYPGNAILEHGHHLKPASVLLLVGAQHHEFVHAERAKPATQRPDRHVIEVRERQVGSLQRGPVGTADRAGQIGGDCVRDRGGDTGGTGRPSGRGRLRWCGRLRWRGGLGCR